MQRTVRTGLNITVVVASTLIALFLLELGLRVAYLKEPFSLRNFSADDIDYRGNNIAIAYDPLIGYISSPGRKGGPGFTIGESGIHLNYTLTPQQPTPPLQTGGILAVGDSFVYGSEVSDDETWPAQLERLLGVPVSNGAAGGYGYDQAILRAEQLLDVVKPRLIIIGCIPNCNDRNDVSVNSGLVKPYFDIVDDQLVLRNVPVPPYVPTAKHVGWARAAFGRFYVATWVADRLGYGSVWKFKGRFEDRKEHDYGSNITCLLWKRLADRVADRKIPIIALVEYAGTQVILADDSRKSEHVDDELECARKSGITIVDSFSELTQRYAADKQSFWNLWNREAHDKEWNTGHMSKQGNRVIAELLAAAIRTQLPNAIEGTPRADAIENDQPGEQDAK